MGKVNKIKLSDESREYIRKELIRLTHNRIRLAYSFAMAIDLLVDSINNTMMAFDVPYSGEQRRGLTEMSKVAKQMDFNYERMIEGPITEIEGWDTYQNYRSNANELVQLMMKYINATRTYQKRDAVFAVLDKLAEDEDKSLFRKEEIERFNL